MISNFIRRTCFVAAGIVLLVSTQHGWSQSRFLEPPEFHEVDFNLTIHEPVRGYVTDIIVTINGVQSGKLIETKPLQKIGNVFRGKFYLSKDIKELVNGVITMTTPGASFVSAYKMPLRDMRADSATVTSDEYKQDIYFTPLRVTCTSQGQPIKPELIFSYVDKNSGRKVKLGTINNTKFDGNGVVNTFLCIEEHSFPEGMEIEVEGKARNSPLLSCGQVPYAMERFVLRRTSLAVSLDIGDWVDQVRQEHGALLTASMAMSPEDVKRIRDVKITTEASGGAIRWVRPLSVDWADGEIIILANTTPTDTHSMCNLSHEWMHQILYVTDWENHYIPASGHSIFVSVLSMLEARDEALAGIYGYLLPLCLAKGANTTKVKKPLGDQWVDPSEGWIRGEAYNYKAIYPQRLSPGAWIEGVVARAMLEMYRQLGFDERAEPVLLFNQLFSDLRAFSNATASDDRTGGEFFRFKGNSLTDVNKRRIVEQIALWYFIREPSAVQSIDGTKPEESQLVPVEWGETGPINMKVNDARDLRVYVCIYPPLGKTVDFRKAKVKLMAFDGTDYKDQGAGFDLTQKSELQPDTSKPPYNYAATWTVTCTGPGGGGVKAFVMSDICDGENIIPVGHSSARDLKITKPDNTLEVEFGSYPLTIRGDQDLEIEVVKPSVAAVAHIYEWSILENGVWSDWKRTEGPEAHRLPQQWRTAPRDNAGKTLQVRAKVTSTDAAQAKGEATTEEIAVAPEGIFELRTDKQQYIISDFIDVKLEGDVSSLGQVSCYNWYASGTPNIGFAISDHEFEAYDEEGVPAVSPRDPGGHNGIKTAIPSVKLQAIAKGQSVKIICEARLASGVYKELANTFIKIEPACPKSTFPKSTISAGVELAAYPDHSARESTGPTDIIRLHGTLSLGTATVGLQINWGLIESRAKIEEGITRIKEKHYIPPVASDVRSAMRIGDFVGQCDRNGGYIVGYLVKGLAGLEIYALSPSDHPRGMDIGNPARNMNGGFDPHVSPAAYRAAINPFFESVRLGSCTDEIGVTIVPTKNPPWQKGDTIVLMAKTTGTDKPLIYKWSGDADGSMDTVSIPLTRAGEYSAKVSVSWANGYPVGEDTYKWEVGSYALKIERRPPAQESYVGHPAMLAPLLTGGTFDPEKLLFQWQGDNNVEIKPIETRSPRQVVQATFIRPGKTAIVVQMLEDKGGSQPRVAESVPPFETEVLPPKLTMTLTPSAPLVGQTAKVVVICDPMTDEKYVEFAWKAEPSRGIRMLGTDKDGREQSFRLLTTNAVKLIAEGSVPHYGDDLGETNVTIRAMPYSVSISQATVNKWNIKGGGVNTPISTIGVDQPFTLSVTIDPKPESDSWSPTWTAEPSGCLITGSKEATVRASKAGTYNISVKVKDSRDGVELGGDRIQIRVSGEEKTAAEAMKLARELWAQGKIDEAVDKAKEAQKAAPKDVAIQNEAAKMGRNRDSIKVAVGGAEVSKVQKKLIEAEAGVKIALALNEKYPPAIKLLDEITKLKQQMLDGWQKEYLKAQTQYNAGDFTGAQTTLAPVLTGMQQAAGIATSALVGQVQELQKKIEAAIAQLKKVMAKSDEINGKLNLKPKQLQSAIKLQPELVNVAGNLPGEAVKRIKDDVATKIASAQREYNAFISQKDLAHDAAAGKLDWKEAKTAAEGKTVWELSAVDEAARKKQVETAVAKEKEQADAVRVVGDREQEAKTKPGLFFLDGQGDTAIRELQDKQRLFGNWDPRRAQFDKVIEQFGNRKQAAGWWEDASQLYVKAQQDPDPYATDALEQVLALCKKSIVYYSPTPYIDFIAFLENEIAKRKELAEQKKKADNYWAQAVDLYTNKQKLVEAENKCRESVNADPNPSDAHKNWLADLTQANQLWDEGFECKGRNDLECTLAKCKESIGLAVNDNRRNFVAQLEQIRAQALDWSRKGEQSERGGKVSDLQAAIEQYRESQKLWPNPELDAIIKRLQARIEDLKWRMIQQAMGKVPSATATAVVNLAGAWVTYQNGVAGSDCEIEQQGGNLKFIIKRTPEVISKGHFVDANTVVAEDFGDFQGKVSADGKRIEWIDSEWVRPGAQPTGIGPGNESKLFAAPGKTTGSGEIAEFVWLGKDADKVGRGSVNKPDGQNDGHFRVRLAGLAPNTEVRTINIYVCDANGNRGGSVWRTEASSLWILGTFQNGIFINSGRQIPLGRYSGDVSFDLYGSDDGSQKAGAYMIVDVDVGGKKLTEITRIQQPVAGQGQPSSSGILGTWKINANNNSGQLEFSGTAQGLTGRVYYDAHGYWEDLKDVSYNPATGELRFLRPISAMQHYQGAWRGTGFEGELDSAGTPGYKWKIWR